MLKRFLIMLMSVLLVFCHGCSKETPKDEPETVNDDKEPVVESLDAVYDFDKGNKEFYLVSVLQLVEGKWVQCERVSGNLEEHNQLRVINGHRQKSNDYSGTNADLIMMIQFSVNGQEYTVNVPSTIKGKVVSARYLFTDELRESDEQVVGFIVSVAEGIDVMNTFDVSYYENPAVFETGKEMQVVAITLKKN